MCEILCMKKVLLRGFYLLFHVGHWTQASLVIITDENGVRMTLLMTRASVHA